MLKAMAKEPPARYATAREMADDLRRFLADEPIRARRPSLAGRAAKWTRRHRPLVWSAAASVFVVLAALLAGTVLVLGAYQREKTQRGIADQNAARAEDHAKAARENAARAQENAAAAQKNYEAAGQAVRQMLTRVANEELAKIPEMKDVRRRLLEDAAAFYTKLIEFSPRDSRAYYERGGVYLTLTQFDKAHGDYEKAVELDAENAEYHRALGAFLLRCGDVAFRNRERGLCHVKRAIQLDPREPLQHEWLGSTYLSSGKVEEARAEYRRGAALVPGTGLEQLFLSLDCALNHDHEGRLRHLKKGAEIEPTNFMHHVWLSEVYQKVGRSEEAIAAATKAIDIAKKNQAIYDPHACSIHLTRAEAYWALKMDREALADCDTSIQLAPFRSFTYKRRAVVHFHMKNYDKALADIAKAVELNPDDVSNVRWIPLQLVAKCPDQRFRRGMFELADKTVQLNQGASDSYRAVEPYGSRARLHAVLGRRKEALADFEKARQLRPRHGLWIPREGCESNAYVIHYALLQPDKARWDQALADLRHTLRSRAEANPAWLHWVSRWLPAMMQDADSLPGVVFVSDMPWVRSSRGDAPSPAVRDTDFGHLDGTNPIAGLPYSKNILTHAFPDERAADVVVDVATHNFKVLRAHVGPCDNGPTPLCS